MFYIRKEVYDLFDDVFIKVHTLTEAYHFFSNIFSENQDRYSGKEYAQMCNILHIFNQYAEQIQADINAIYEQAQPEY